MANKKKNGALEKSSGKCLAAVAEWYLERCEC
jgi:hypothetical protein